MFSLNHRPKKKKKENLLLFLKQLLLETRLCWCAWLLPGQAVQGLPWGSCLHGSRNGSCEPAENLLLAAPLVPCGAIKHLACDGGKH